MIRSLAAIFLLFAFASQTFKGYFIMLDYYTHTAAFAKNCVNKAKPTMHCNGHCQMMKKMQAEEQKDEQVPERKFENKTEVFSNHSFDYSFEADCTIIASQKVFFDKNYPVTDRSYSFFHPPQV
jgi:hypothetical protein